MIHPDKIKKVDSELKIGEQTLPLWLWHYLTQTPIAGTERSRLAECLGVWFVVCCLLFSYPTYSTGLDPGRYPSSNSREAEERGFATLNSQISDTECFKECAPFRIHCWNCKGEALFEPISNYAVSISWWLSQIHYWTCLAQSSVLQHTGPTCPNCSHMYLCKSNWNSKSGRILRRLDGMRWSHMWQPHAHCMMSVYHCHCLHPGCKGRVVFEVSSITLTG